MKSEIPNCFYRVSVKALILDETRTKFLIIEEHDGKWELPGGGLDFGEKPLEGLAREIKEEMGLVIKEIENRPAYFTTMLSETKNYYYANVIYEVKVFDLNFIPSNECISIKFVTKEEALGMNILPNVREFIKYFDPKNH
ncbi:MAG: NUDIX hydrolase [Patescibacteria group bacterium]